MIETYFSQLILDALDFFHLIIRPRPSFVAFGATPFFDLKVMFDFVIKNRCNKILELGAGSSTKMFLTVLYFKNKGHLTSIDSNPCFQINYFVNYFKDLKRFWTFIKADDTKIEWNKQVDLLFIDTSHKYSHTLKELRKFSPFVRKAIFLHDYGEKHKEQGHLVKKAVNKFLKENKQWQLKKVYKQGYGLALLTKSKS